MYAPILLLHVLAACIWTGGHLVLALTVLPRVLRERDLAGLQRFEAGFERIGIPALLIQIITGLWLAQRLLPDVSRWFDPSDPTGRLIALKLGLLLITLTLAADARLRLIPNLDASRLPSLAWHIVAVTITSLLFVVVGLAFRTGWPV